MNAALPDIATDAVAELRAQQEKAEAKRAARRAKRKDNEVRRRFVVTLTDAEATWVRGNFERLGYEHAPAMLRDMAFLGLKTSGNPSAREIEIASREAELARLRAQED